MTYQPLSLTLDILIPNTTWIHNIYGKLIARLNEIQSTNMINIYTAKIICARISQYISQ